jgi:hypothetical protein
MLRYSGQALIKQIFEVIVLSLDHECAAPEIRSPMANRMDEADELALVGRELCVACDDGPTEEGDRPCALVQDGAKARA